MAGENRRPAEGGAEEERAPKGAVGIAAGPAGAADGAACGKAADSGSASSKVESAKITRMGSGSIPKLVAEFAVPSVCGMLVNGAYNVISSIFLGQAMGELGLSVATAANPTMIVFMALSMLVGMGGNALCALRLGEGRHDKAEQTLGNTVTLSLIIWVIVFFLAMCPPIIDALLTISSATDTVRPFAQTYIRILSAGMIFQCIGAGVNNFIRTAGAPNRALVTMVVGAVSCAAFNFLYVMVLGWGVPGSAFATVCGQAVSCATVLWYFIKTKSSPLKLRLSCMRPDAATIGKILSLGLASFAVQAAAAVVNFVINYVLVTYGAQSSLGSENALACMGVVQRLAMFSVLPIIGVSAAIQPLLGFNYGARLINRVRTTLKWGVGTATVLGVIFWLILQLFPQQIVALFGITNAGLLVFTTKALTVWMIMLPFIGFQITCANYFQATGQPLKSTVLSLTRQVIFLIPALLILPEAVPHLMPGLEGIDGIYFATPVADFAAIFTTAVVMVPELKRLKKIERGEIEVKY